MCITDFYHTYNPGFRIFVYIKFCDISTFILSLKNAILNLKFFRFFLRRCLTEVLFFCTVIGLVIHFTVDITKRSTDLITKMQLFGDDARSLYMLNSELAARVYSAPSLVL